MREIDPIREPAEALLSSALHRLAKAGERNAPPELGSALAAEFRQHHRRRRIVRFAAAGAIAATLLLAALLVFSPRRTQRPQVVQSPAQPQPQVVQDQSATTSAGPQKKQQYAVVRGDRQVASFEQDAQGSAFIPLPAYDAATAGTDVRVVRMEVTGSDLMMVGAPVSAELADNRVLADFVVGSDGTPYAVRLVQQ
jgi:hypothetical protein